MIFIWGCSYMNFCNDRKDALRQLCPTVFIVPILTSLGYKTTVAIIRLFTLGVKWVNSFSFIILSFSLLNFIMCIFCVCLVPEQMSPTLSKCPSLCWLGQVLSEPPILTINFLEILEWQRLWTEVLVGFGLNILSSLPFA